MAGALAPVAVQQVSGLARRVLRRRFDNTAKALRIAADLHQVGLDIFTERLAEDDSDERIELLARVIQAAASATFPAKVEALGRVLADGLMEDSDAAEALVLARALESLDRAHVVVLDHIERNRVPDPELLEENLKAIAGWQVPLLAQVLPDLAAIMDSIVAALSGVGLLRDNTGVNYASQPGPEAWAITCTGVRCLGLLDPSRDN
ncbi:MAG: hypothetical protein ACXV3F_00810 [Frankiaceae bacterium]